MKNFSYTCMFTYILGKCLGVEELGHMVFVYVYVYVYVNVYVYVYICQTVFQNSYSLLHSFEQYMKVPITPIFSNSYHCVFFIMVLVCFSLINKHAALLVFSCLHILSSLVKCLFQYFAQYLLGFRNEGIKLL